MASAVGNVVPAWPARTPHGVENTETLTGGKKGRNSVKTHDNVRLQAAAVGLPGPEGEMGVGRGWVMQMFISKAWRVFGDGAPRFCGFCSSAAEAQTPHSKPCTPGCTV